MYLVCLYLIDFDLNNLKIVGINLILYSFWIGILLETFHWKLCKSKEGHSALNESSKKEFIVNDLIFHLKFRFKPKVDIIINQIHKPNSARLKKTKLGFLNIFF